MATTRNAHDGVGGAWNARSCVWVVLASAVLAVTVSCGDGAPPQITTNEIVAVERSTLLEDPTAAAWREAPVCEVSLIPQDMVEPRLLTPSTALLDVRAVTDGARIAFRLEWNDPTSDELPGAARFSDACALQFPASRGADVPAPQMGEADRPVEITYWRASWQAAVDGRVGDDIRALYPGATVDHYPFEAAALDQAPDEQAAMALRYAPAAALGNRMGTGRDRSIEDLVAEGPGTLRPAYASAPRSETRSGGHGERNANAWTVVLWRDLPRSIDDGGRTQVAFAIWDGDSEEVGARKMRSVWIPLVLKESAEGEGSR